ncbi:MAG: family 10 glycosylhydrolase [Acidobacteria bacterium]|nr:family 10 glycosylhydrolase [Acidobacteriota bacterium]
MSARFKPILACAACAMLAVAAPGVMPAGAQTPGAASVPPAASPEIRAIWVDAFHAGIRSPREAAQLVADAKRLHLNTLIVQVRRRGDALYASALEPPLDDPNYDPAFDALGHIVSAAHAEGLQVHAWINAMPVWRDEVPPKDPRHVFNRHGTAAAGDECWLTASREGVQKFPVGYFLDPGHPAAQDHLVRVYTDIVRRYQVDGIHFDYIRYPETTEVMPRGSNVGYNAVSVRRFRRATGRTGVPAPDDDAWTAWRRQQVTELMRRISIEARAINPTIRVSAATIAWGRPPATLAEFANAAPMQRIFQNWQAWLVEGLLDVACPMNYAREHDPRVRGWFNGWIAWEKRHKAARQLVIGIGGYLSAADNVLAQISRARTADGKRRADGTSIFSYASPAAAATPSTPAAAPAPVPAVPSPDRLDFLVRGAGTAAPAYSGPAAVPPMPWIDRPIAGMLAGTIAGADGVPVDGATIQVRRTGWFRRTARISSDGNGWFGRMQLKPGTYRVRQELPRGRAAATSVTVAVRAGDVARVALTER